MCAFGCPTSAKQHVGITYVPRAEAAGAQVIAGADVRHVLVERGQARGVQARLASGGRLEVRAPTVILIAAESALSSSTMRSARRTPAERATSTSARAPSERTIPD